MWHGRHKINYTHVIMKEANFPLRGWKVLHALARVMTGTCYNAKYVLDKGEAWAGRTFIYICAEIKMEGENE